MPNKTTPSIPSVSHELEVNDVAKHFKVSAALVREWLRTGTLRGYKLGKYWRTSWAAVDAFKSSCRGI